MVSIDQSKVHGILISAWIGKKKILNLSLLNDVKKTIPSIDKLGSFYTWAHTAYSKLTWALLINNLGSNENLAKTSRNIAQDNVDETVNGSIVPVHLSSPS